MCTNNDVHMFNAWTINMQSSNIKEWKLLELQITQTRHHPSILRKEMSLIKTQKKKKSIMNVHKIYVWTIIMQSLNIKEWKLLEVQITQTRHP